MEEIITNELLEEIAKNYRAYIETFPENPQTFLDFLNKELRIRAWNLRKGGIHVKI